jgi:hypothetical protein
MVVHATVELKKWSKVTSSSAEWSNVSASVSRSMGVHTRLVGGVLIADQSTPRKNECFRIWAASPLPRRTSGGLRSLQSATANV